MIHWIFRFVLICMLWADGEAKLRTYYHGSCLPPSLECDTNKCIAQQRLCDGIQDCVDGTDESLQCDISLSCPDSFFACKSGRELVQQCLPRIWLCDGKVDCQDGSDEASCESQVLIDCDGFQCPSGLCLKKEEVCDGINNCEKGEDEDNCVFQCGEAQFRCGALPKCINSSKVCDKRRDCPNGSDEPNECSINECHSKRKLCHHQCTDLPIGYQCSCYPGYQLDADLIHCRDINECEDGNSCSHLCHNLDGGYRCSCKHGYQLDGKTHCKAEGKRFFIISSGSRITKSSDFSSPVEFVGTHDKEFVTAMSQHVALGFLYWSDRATKVVKRSSLLDSSKVEVIVSGKGTPSDLAIDWVAYKLYWIDEMRKLIQVSELDGKYTAAVVKGLKDPRSLVLDPRAGNRYIYWCDWGSRMRIHRISMDGDQVTRDAIHIEDSSKPDGLVIDFPSDRLYWFDGGRRTIESRHLIYPYAHDVFTVDYEPTSLFIFEDLIYWTGKDDSKIFTINRLSGERDARLFASVTYPNGLLVFNEAVQPEVVRPVKEIHCSHLMVLSHLHGYTCLCPSSLYLLNDGRTCNSSEAVKCSNEYCYHEGQCIEDANGTNFPTCRCQPGFSGPRCETISDVLFPVYKDGELVKFVCVDNYCFNHGTCIESSGSLPKPTCKCMLGYYGERCEFYYGYMLDSTDAKAEEDGVLPDNVQVSDGVVNIAAIASALFFVLCVILIVTVNKWLKNLPSYDIVVNPRYDMGSPQSEDNNDEEDEIIVNVDGISPIQAL